MHTIDKENWNFMVQYGTSDKMLQHHISHDFQLQLFFEPSETLVPICHVKSWKAGCQWSPGVRK